MEQFVQIANWRFMNLLSQRKLYESKTPTLPADQVKVNPEV